MDLEKRLAFAEQIAREAGDLVLQSFQLVKDFKFKDDESPVTSADLAAEELLRDRIMREFPGEEILGEEHGGDPESADRWVLDPIDGTKSFMACVPLFATLVSYECDQIPLLGTAYFPALGELVSAARGHGTRCNGELCMVKSNADPGRAIIATAGHKSARISGRTEGIDKLAATCLATRTWCDAYGHALVATGRVDAMIDPVVSRWDVSAMAVIVREAGGCFTDFSGREQVTNEAISVTPGMKHVVWEAFGVS